MRRYTTAYRISKNKNLNKSTIASNPEHFCGEKATFGYYSSMWHCISLPHSA